MSNFFILDFYSPNNEFLLINLLYNNLYFIDFYIYPIIDNNIYSFKYIYNIFLSLVNFDFETLKFILINESKFFNKYYSIIILYIYFIFLVYSLSIKWKFYNDWIKFCNNFVNFIKFYSNELYIFSGHFTKLILWNFWYFISFEFRKKTWNRLNFRSLDLKKKEKNKKYIQLQYIKFFYTKFMFDVFFSILIRFLYFLLLYFFRLIIFIIYKIMNFFIFKWHLNILYMYIYVYIITLLRKFISINFFNRVFVVINYFKTEFFIYFFNDRGFLGGFIYYIYSMIYNKIGIFNNNNNWENIEFTYSNIIQNFYYKISPVFVNYDYYKIFYNKYNNLLSIFLFIPMVLLFFIIRIINIFVFLIKNVIIFYQLSSYKLYLYNQYFYMFLSFIIYIWYFHNNILILFLLLYWLFHILMMSINWINNLSKYIINDKIFILLGYISILILDLIKYLLISIWRVFVWIFLKLKYWIIFFILYKLGFIYIIYLGLTNLTFGYIDYWIFYFFDWLLYITFDAYNILQIHMLPSNFSENLIFVIRNDFSTAYENIDSYIKNSFLIRLYTLNFRGIDFSKFKWETFNATRKSAIKVLSLQRFYYNIFLEFLSECYMFSIICKNYFIFKFTKFYYIYLFRYSSLNLYYYLFKKLYTLIYLFYIYLWFYLKFLYLYIVPFYIIPKFIYFKIFYIYTYFNYYMIRIIYVVNWIYYMSSWFLIFLLHFSYENIGRFLYLLNFYWIYIYNIILLIYCIINDLFYLFIHQIIFIEYNNNFIEFYLYYFINKSLFIDNMKDLIINYFRLSKSNLINFNISESLILGGKLRSVSMFDLDHMNMDQVREFGILTQRIDDYLIQSKPEVKHNRYFKNRDNLLIYSDIYLLLFSYYNIDLWESLYMKDFWIFNFFVRKLILYYFIDLYLLYYIILYIMFYYLIENKKEKDKNYNIDYMWNKLKDNFSYKLLNNNKLFINALDYYKISSGKKKITSNLFLILSKNWKIVHKNFTLNILKKYKKIKNLNMKKLKSITLGKYSSFISDNSLRSIIIERNLYYNNKILFYWKNYLFFDKDKSFYIKYNRKNEFLYFFLSLIFHRNIYSSSIFYYFDTFNKMFFFYNKDFLKYLNKTYDIVIKYYEKIDSIFFNNKGDNWLLNKDVSLILYKDEYDHQSDMFSLNFNIIIPNYEKIFFWIVIILYIYLTKFHWRLSPQVDFIGRVNKWIFIKSLLINDNFMYLYDIALYWVNNYFMFDIKHFSYEYNDYVNEWMKNKIYFKHIRPSPSFVVNNDPLYIYKKNNSYHMLFLNKNYSYIYSSYSLYIYMIFKKLFLIILLFSLYNKVIINKKTFNVNLTDNKHILLILNLSYLYIQNMISIGNYINFVYRKILFK